MSIYGSMSYGIDIPARDYYTGEVCTPEEIAQPLSDAMDAASIDVALSTSYHDKVRFSMDKQGASVSALMSADEVAELIDLLQRAYGFVTAKAG
jgi:hypothetical protein